MPHFNLPSSDVQTLIFVDSDNPSAPAIHLGGAPCEVTHVKHSQTMGQG